MSEIIAQSIAKRVPLKAYLSDGVTDATGKTIAVVISKNGGAFANPSAGATNATEIASGWYYVDLSTTDTNTLGPVIVRGTATGVDNTEVVYTVAEAVATAAALATAQADLDNIQTRLPAALVGGRMDSDVGATGANAITAASLAADATAEIADRLLGRSIQGGADGGRTVTSALRPSRNKVEIVAGVMTVYAEDDLTPAFTAAVTTAAGNPITAVDPV